MTLLVTVIAFGVLFVHFTKKINGLRADLEEFEEMLNEEPPEYDGKLALNALSTKHRGN